MQVINPVYMVCYFGMNEMFAWTSMFSRYEEDPVRAFKCAANTLCSSNGLFFQGF